MPPPLATELVQEFVACSHGDLDRVKALLAQEPRLLNAAWDWGGGDFETGLGAASHCGERAIAEYLLAHGAPMTIFAAVMLGRLALARAILADHPEAKDAPGPHGIPLLVHAQMGGEAAAGVVEYLEGLG
ncbi:MAG: ankyrin repeat domain-containing protein [Armatimonadetes bacterium]|nr:ankyrin repeat domain-containing protein [Armatimonadota bacterium]